MGRTTFDEEYFVELDEFGQVQQVKGKTTKRELKDHFRRLRGMMEEE
jgi:hypothetical protein|tara:strand:+ start:1919 stop:2059 length:141 start_codon:yes stop_codon:yes gene_type:complete